MLSFNHSFSVCGVLFPPHLTIQLPSSASPHPAMSTSAFAVSVSRHLCVSLWFLDIVPAFILSVFILSVFILSLALVGFIIRLSVGLSVYGLDISQKGRREISTITIV